MSLFPIDLAVLMISTLLSMLFILEMGKLNLKELLIEPMFLPISSCLFLLEYISQETEIEINDHSFQTSLCGQDQQGVTRAEYPVVTESVILQRKQVEDLSILSIVVLVFLI